MSKYRVTIFRHDNDHRWLADQVFPKRPTQAQIDAAFPVLAEPGRYEVRLGLLSGEDEIHAGGWLQGSYVKDPENPTDAELAAAIDRGLADGSLVDAGGFLNERKAQDMEQTEIIRKDSHYGDGQAWLVQRNGQHFVISSTNYQGEPATQAFRASEAGVISDWGEVAGGRDMTKEQVLAELTQRPADEDGYVLSHTDVLNRAEEAEREQRIETAASEIADSIVKDARGSGGDPIAWVTGNSYMPPLRSFSAAEQVWQADEDGEDFQYLSERVEAKLADAEVALECQDYDNALYAVDQRRFEYVDDPGDHETLQQDWRAKPVHADYPHEPGRLHDCKACEDHCHCTPGYTECVFEGEHNGMAEAEPGTPCAQCGCAS